MKKCITFLTIGKPSFKSVLFGRNFLSLLLFLFLCVFFTNYHSQTVGINVTGASPNPKALLDIDATGMDPKGGLLIPRLTLAERSTIVSPIPESLLIFNKTSRCFEAWSLQNLNWTRLACIDCQLPSPFWVSSASSITKTGVQANWSASVGATTYFLDVSTKSDFSTYLPGYQKLSVSDNLNYSIIGLTCNTTYYFRVWANNSCGMVISSSSMTVLTAGC
jgi:hypothetical protein